MKHIARVSTILLIATIITGIAVAGVLANTIYSLQFHQNPSVPQPIHTFVITSVANGTDQTALGTWNADGNSFIANITITNNSTATYTPIITCNNPPTNWIFSTSALTSIAPNTSLPVTMTMHYAVPATPNSGQIGDFTV